METHMSEVKDNSWFEKIKDLLGDSPKDKKDLISLLTTAANDNLISCLLYTSPSPRDS